VMGDGTPATLATVRALRAGGREPFVALADPSAYATRSRAVAGVDRLADPDGRRAEDTVDDVVAIATRRGVEVMLPGTEGALCPIVGREDRLSVGVVVGTAPAEALANAMDKRALPALAAAAGLDVLPAVEVSAADLDERAAAVPLPGVAKPRASARRRPDGAVSLATVHMVDSLDDVRRLVERDPAERWLVSGGSAARWRRPAASRGRGGWSAQYTSSRRASDRASGASPPSASPWRATATVSAASRAGSRPWDGAASTGCSSCSPKAAPIPSTSARASTGRSHWPSPRGRTSRPSGSISCSAARPVVGAYRVTTRYRVEEDDPRALLGAWRLGDRRAALRGAWPRRHTAHAVFSLSDPGPAPVTLRNLARQ